MLQAFRVLGLGGVLGPLRLQGLLRTHGMDASNEQTSDVTNCKLGGLESFQQHCHPSNSLLAYSYRPGPPYESETTVVTKLLPISCPRTVKRPKAKGGRQPDLSPSHPFYSPAKKSSWVKCGMPQRV